MKHTASLTLMILLAAIVSHPRAAIKDPLASTGCETALREHYGEQAEFKLVNRRNSRQGLVLKVSVSNASEASYKWEARFCTCLVSRSGGDAVVEETRSSAQPSNPAAASAGPVPETRRAY